ncbi:Detected protein of unknown function [Hibiscus syriacus]|uniref:DUF7356 domain-containing protein n=1 Tax=Hibiscus syriacus TaxID=106335 RepID=A0A6A3BRD4_HIBSY|nr:uncharacterized protein LOC120212591 [Hibiscus syriacus]KAE8718587.1 Detected protein of unknown function [Hibiscus syriacus]
MDRYAITTACLLFLIVADVSNASLFWKLRFLADESPTKNDTTAGAPPISQSPTKKSDPKPDTQSKLDPNPLNRTNSANQPPVDKKDPKLSDEPGKVIPPPPQKGIDSGTNSSSTSNHKTVEDNEDKKNNASTGNNSSSTSNSTGDKTLEGKEEKKNDTYSAKKPNSTGTEQADVSKEDENKKPPKKTNENGNKTQSGIVETCDGVANSCNDGNYLTACIKGSKQWVVLVHNSGGKSLKVNVAGPSGESLVKGLKVPKHGTQTINIPLTISETGELLLSAGNGDCVLHMNPIASEGNPFLNLPYDKLLTPVNGAYFMIATVLVFGGSWACCMFRKKRRRDGIPYQELEMGLPESMAATEVETAEGWDQGWDSDWDDGNAGKSSMGRHNVSNISANGLTTRSSNRDGWENDWDD